jgi:hypothetical protein
MRLAGTLLAYGHPARRPVILITAPAIFGDRGTHYDTLPFEGGVAVKLLATVGFS